VVIAGYPDAEKISARPEFHLRTFFPARKQPGIGFPLLIELWGAKIFCSFKVMMAESTRLEPSRSPLKRFKVKGPVNSGLSSKTSSFMMGFPCFLIKV
jgi:hypothetical protein